MQNLTRGGFTLVLTFRYESAHFSADLLNEVQQKWMSDEIPVVVATIAFGMGIHKANAKKGLSDDVKDIQIKALQTGLEKMIEDCEKAKCRHKLMASFFNESYLKKCLKNCDFCRILEKVIQQANALKTRREAIVRTAIQALDDNSSQTDNQQKAADIEYNSCYLQSKTLSSYNHKAAQSYVVFI
ncbi:hypothetical protein WR25_10906 [Diploscapter pachys]|uniref:ATP-dependent DNA helicase RecQ zinc-binding domain-containing protein n=1 Tax=Diploscapter pachys TaxID=2018661 RepID=A0A2A2LH87_9BILA|nr:hypothetical protein WR25_10906 [Diploscapter pachys]